jgi:hypothetical protein
MGDSDGVQTHTTKAWTVPMFGRDQEINELVEEINKMTDADRHFIKEGIN